MALQGSILGYVVHGMQGFDYKPARTDLNIPEEFTVEAMAATGFPGNMELLPDRLQNREFPSDRRPLERGVYEGCLRGLFTRAVSRVELLLRHYLSSSRSSFFIRSRF